MKGIYIKIVAILAIAVFAAPAVAAATGQVSEGVEEFVSYYDQLDLNGKAIYDAMNSAEADETSITVKLPVALTAASDDSGDGVAYLKKHIKTTVDNAFVALRLSSPLAYWTWEQSVVTYDDEPIVVSGVATKTTLVFKISYALYPVDQETGVFQGIQKMLDDLETEISKFQTTSDTIRGKVLDINNYLVNLVTYDPNWLRDNQSKYTHDVYGVFVDPLHYAVCDGYSKAFLLLCEREGIESVVVLGTALPKLENHAWNYVKMDDGEWYAMDVTWNDNGQGDNPYFLNGGETFFTNHQQTVFLTNGVLAYRLNSPAISATAYDAPGTDNYELYSWLLAIVIVSAMSIALYRFAKKGS